MATLGNIFDGGRKFRLFLMGMTKEISKSQNFEKVKNRHFARAVPPRCFVRFASEYTHLVELVEIFKMSAVAGHMDFSSRRYGPRKMAIFWVLRG